MYMRFLTDRLQVIQLLKIVFLAVIMMSAPGTVLAQVDNNPLEIAAIYEGVNGICSATSKEVTGLTTIATTQGMIGAEMTMMRKWQKNYNSYLKSARGYADAIKAGCTLYADGVALLRNIYTLKKACEMNPEGIVASSVGWTDVYLEAACQVVKVYSILRSCVAKGGEGNMLNGEERTEMLWTLSDELARLNSKLNAVALNIAFHNMADVWNKYTAGMIEKSHGQIAEEALSRWKRASKASYQLNQ